MVVLLFLQRRAHRCFDKAFVEMYDNRKRAHLALGYLSPFEYEKQALLS